MTEKTPSIVRAMLLGSILVYLASCSGTSIQESGGAEEPISLDKINAKHDSANTDQVSNLMPEYTQQEWDDMRKQKAELEIILAYNQDSIPAYRFEAQSSNGESWISVPKDAYTTRVEKVVLPYKRKAVYAYLHVELTKLVDFWKEDSPQNTEGVTFRAVNDETGELLWLSPLNADKIQDIDVQGDRLIWVGPKSLEKPIAIDLYGQKGFIEVDSPVNVEQINRAIQQYNIEVSQSDQTVTTIHALYRSVLPAGTIARPVNDWPMNYDDLHTNNLQGITNDGTFWYMVNASVCGSGRSNCSWYEWIKDSSWAWLRRKVPYYHRLMWYLRDSNLNSYSAGGALGKPFPEWRHPGGMSSGYHSKQGIEHHVSLTEPFRDENRSAIAVIPDRTYGNRNTYAILTIPSSSNQYSTTGLPWVAYDRRSDSYFSSIFYDEPNNGGERLNRYKIIRNYYTGKPERLQDCGYVYISGLGSDPLFRVQGGEFSPSGLLYLSTDPTKQHNINKGPIRIIEIDRSELTKCQPHKTHYSARHISNLYIPKRSGKNNDEIEDITIWDLDAQPSYGGRRLGQMHTIMIDVDPGIDDLYLKHFRINRGQRW